MGPRQDGKKRRLDRPCDLDPFGIERTHIMTTANQITPGMTLNIDGKIFRVESSVKVTVAKGTPFVKTKLRNLITDETIERNFKLEQTVQEVSLLERNLEFLYPEGKEYLFLDVGNLEQVMVPAQILSDKVN